MYENSNSKVNQRKAFPAAHDCDSNSTEETAELGLSQLLAVIYRTAVRRGQTIQQVAEVRGITTGYLGQLFDGVKKPENISRELVGSIAAYLKVPPVIVQVLASKIQAGDFMMPSDTSTHLVEVSDGGLEALMPAQIEDAPEEVKSYVLLLLQEARQTLDTNQRRLPLVMHELLRASLILEVYQNQQG